MVNSNIRHCCVSLLCVFVFVTACLCAQAGKEDVRVLKAFVTTPDYYPTSPSSDANAAASHAITSSAPTTNSAETTSNTGTYSLVWL